MLSIILLLTLSLSLSIPTPGQHSYTLSRPEGTRTYYVWIPKSYNGTIPYPVHYSWHGLGDSCENYGPAVGFQQLSETYNFLYIYPCATNGLIGTAWNAGTCCLQPTTVDDVGFARAILDQMKTDFNVDGDKIWSSGFSNGAMMSEILACNASDIFTAVASVSGIVELEPGNAAGLELCNTNFANQGKNVDVLQIHGDADSVVPWDGDSLLGFPDVPTDMADWALRNGCSKTTKQTLNVDTFTNSVWEDCKNNVNVELVKNSGGSHEWPSSKNFDTSTYICEFFKKSAARN